MVKKKKNRNIVLLKSIDDLQNEISYQDFDYKDYFFHICDLIPDQTNERLKIETINKDNINKEGLVYVFVINDKIFKIGHTINSIKKRVSSYNCGKTEHRISGTNSTTNYFVLQSFLKINQKINVYAFFPENPKYILFNIDYQDGRPPSKTAENKILQDFIIKHKKKPIGCTQT